MMIHLDLSRTSSKVKVVGNKVTDSSTEN